MSHNVIRVGVVGVGFGATIHIPVVQDDPETEVVAVCSRHLDIVTGEQARHVIEIIEKAYISAQMGQAQEISSRLGSTG